MDIERLHLLSVVQLVNLFRERYDQVLLEAGMLEPLDVKGTGETALSVPHFSKHGSVELSIHRSKDCVDVEFRSVDIPPRSLSRVLGKPNHTGPHHYRFQMPNPTDDMAYCHLVLITHLAVSYALEQERLE